MVTDYSETYRLDNLASAVVGGACGAPDSSSTYSLQVKRVTVAKITLSDTNTHKHTSTQQDSSGRETCQLQKPPPDITQEPDSRIPGVIRTRNPSKRAAADVRHKTRGYWDRL